MAERQAVGHEQDPDNVAPLAVYLASDAASTQWPALHSFGAMDECGVHSHDAARRVAADGED